MHGLSFLIEELELDVPQPLLWLLRGGLGGTQAILVSTS